MDVSEEVLVFIKEFVGDNGYAPTIREIKDGCSISSTSVVSMYLDRLEKRGQITRTKNIARGIVVKQ